MVFIPDYENGAQPYGQFVCGQLWVGAAWHNSGDFTRDLGACAIGNNALGQTLPATVGTLGFAWNQIRQRHLERVRLPAGRAVQRPVDGRLRVVARNR